MSYFSEGGINYKSCTWILAWVDLKLIARAKWVFCAGLCRHNLTSGHTGCCFGNSSRWERGAVSRTKFTVFGPNLQPALILDWSQETSCAGRWKPDTGQKRKKRKKDTGLANNSFHPLPLLPFADWRGQRRPMKSCEYGNNHYSATNAPLVTLV